MADDEKSQGDDVLTKVARRVGTALGAVTSAAAEIVGDKDDRTQTNKNPRQENRGNKTQARQRERMKAKRAKHRRKLHRKTKG
jgi:hypothetical protein